MAARIRAATAHDIGEILAIIKELAAYEKAEVCLQKGIIN